MDGKHGFLAIICNHAGHKQNIFNQCLLPLRLAKSQMDNQVLASWDEKPWRYIRVWVQDIGYQDLRLGLHAAASHMHFTSLFSIWSSFWAGSSTQSWRCLAKEKTMRFTTQPLLAKGGNPGTLSNLFPRPFHVYICMYVMIFCLPGSHLKMVPTHVINTKLLYIQNWLQYLLLIFFQPPCLWPKPSGFPYCVPSTSVPNSLHLLPCVPGPDAKGKPKCIASSSLPKSSKL